MKQLIISLSLLGVFITCTLDKKQSAPALEQSTINILKRNTTDGIILDCRTAEEYSKAHVPGAMNIDVLDSSIKEQLTDLDKSRKYYIYCEGGHRSAKLAAIMLEEGFTNLVDLQDGFSNWDGRMASIVSEK